MSFRSASLTVGLDLISGANADYDDLKTKARKYDGKDYDKFNLVALDEFISGNKKECKVFDSVADIHTKDPVDITARLICGQAVYKQIKTKYDTLFEQYVDLQVDYFVVGCLYALQISWPLFKNDFKEYYELNGDFNLPSTRQYAGSKRLKPVSDSIYENTDTEKYLTTGEADDLVKEYRFATLAVQVGHVLGPMRAMGVGKAGLCPDFATDAEFATHDFFEPPKGETRCGGADKLATWTRWLARARERVKLWRDKIIHMGDKSGLSIYDRWEFDRAFPGAKKYKILRDGTDWDRTAVRVA
jgi:hypothetical protein